MMTPKQRNNPKHVFAPQQEFSPLRGPSAASSTKKTTGTAKIRNPRISSVKRKLFTVFTVMCSTVVTYYICEAVYRYSKYQQLINANVFPDVVTEAPMDRFNPQTGFSYIPNTQTRYLKFNSEGDRLPIDIFLRINNMGHISWNDDRIEKPASEFRIAVLGDSFTAALEMQKPWPDILEELLNQDQNLKQTLDVSTFNVINFGRDGIGITQCADIHRHEVSNYNADLVILNFIEDDFLRRHVYRDTVQRDLGDFRYHVAVHTYSLPCKLENTDSFFGTVSLARLDFESPGKWKRLRQDLAQLQSRRIRWFSLYPDFLASRIGYRVGFHPRLFTSYSLAYVVQDEVSGFNLALQSCRQIQKTSKSALFLYIPIDRMQVFQLSSVVKVMMKLCPDLNITPMSRHLMVESDSVDVERWFIPQDGHFNDYGGRIYAKAVYAKLKQHFSNSLHRIEEH